MMKHFIVTLWAMGLSMGLVAKTVTIDVSDYGITPQAPHNMAALQQVLAQQQQVLRGNDKVIISFPKGIYHFSFDTAPQREIYVTNHDQTEGKKIAFDLHHMQQVTVDGQGSTFLFEGVGIPFVVDASQHITLKNFTINYTDPQITEIEIVEKGKQGTTFKVHDPNRWGAKQYTLDASGKFTVSGHGWSMQPGGGIAFEKGTHHIIYNTGDIGVNLTECQQRQGLFLAPHWTDDRLPKGTIIALRDWSRPTPGLLLSESQDTQVEDVTVHYAYGMALVAQCCRNITLDHFQVVPEMGKASSTQADATHFCQCAGAIKSVNGTYTGMMDDAINVHGVYLRMVQRIDDHTALFRYMHPQAWGYPWGAVGEKVRFIRSKVMETLSAPNTITAIVPQEGHQGKGMHTFRISFKEVIPEDADGVENFSRTPTVYFAHNYISNNRARGALFSSPRNTICEYNFFDHTSGSAILVAGDCNGWYESGPVEQLTIRHNTFHNALTSRYQFTNGIISIYPEVPDLTHQSHPYHRHICIENNVFENFRTPLLYAKSVSGLTFRNNIFKCNQDYPSLFAHPSSLYWIDAQVHDLDIKNNTTLPASPKASRQP